MPVERLVAVLRLCVRCWYFLPGLRAAEDLLYVPAIPATLPIVGGRAHHVEAAVPQPSPAATAEAAAAAGAAAAADAAAYTPKGLRRHSTERGGQSSEQATTSCEAGL